MKIKITIYTKKGEVHSYENVNKCDVHDVGPGILTFLHDDRYIEYYRLGTLDRWTVEEEAENECQTKRKEDLPDMRLAYMMSDKYRENNKEDK